MSLIPDFVKGMGRTLKHAVGTTFGPESITVNYPEQEKPRPRRFRGRHILNRYDNGLERCIGCSLCAAACLLQSEVQIRPGSPAESESGAEPASLAGSASLTESGFPARAELPPQFEESRPVPLGGRDFAGPGPLGRGPSPSTGRCSTRWG